MWEVKKIGGFFKEGRKVQCLLGALLLILDSSSAGKRVPVVEWSGRNSKSFYSLQLPTLELLLPPVSFVIETRLCVECKHLFFLFRDYK